MNRDWDFAGAQPQQVMPTLGGILINTDFEKFLDKLLIADENVLWIGKPKQGFIIRPYDYIFAPFAIFWCGSLIWHLFIDGSKTPSIVYIFTSPFIAFVVWILFGHFCFDIWRRNRTYYCVTSDRILFISGKNRFEEKSLFLNEITNLSIEYGTKDRGTIYFVEESFWQLWRQGGISQYLHYTGTPCFERIDNYRYVYNLIKEAKTNTRFCSPPESENK